MTGKAKVKMKAMRQWFAFEGFGVLWGRLWPLVAVNFSLVAILWDMFGPVKHDLGRAALGAFLNLIFGPVCIAAAWFGEYLYLAVVATYIVHLTLVVGYLFSVNKIVRMILFATLVAIGLFSAFCACMIVWATC